ncbi:MAG: beta-N-acetylhexosaminidase [Polyangia bacterium]
MSSATHDEAVLAGRLILAGFDGTALPDRIARDLERGALAGIVLFSRNVESPAQVRRLTDEARRAAGGSPAPIVAVDQEGGRVVRLRDPLTVLPPARTLGAIDDPELTELAGRLVGAELRAVGFTLDLAPVLDVDTNPDSPVIGDRSYGASPAAVMRHGLAFARGLKDGGVLPCAKHFPGHGRAAVDSHLSLPRVDCDRESLEAVELEPFCAWCRTGLGPVMIAHAVYPAFDPEGPATASRSVVRGELRERLRFGGAVLSDDLEMGAVGESGGPAAVAVRALAAGVDGMLVCRSAEVLDEVRDGLARALSSEPGLLRRVEIASCRLAALGEPPGPDVDLDWLESADHRAARSLVTERIRGATEQS